MSSNWCLPSELTRAVLSLLGEDASTKSVCGSMLVCKAWKVWTRVLSKPEAECFIQAIGETVLFENVRIWRADQLRAVRVRLYQGAYVDDCPVGRMIHGLKLGGLLEDDGSKPAVNDVTELVLSIVMLSPCLQQYTMCGWTMNQADFICLSQSAGASVTYLDVLLRSDADGIFPIINSFRNLKTFILELEDGPWVHSRSHPIQNNCLRRVSWTSYRGDEAMYSFLSQCSFGSYCVFSLNFAYATPSISLINPMFSTNLFSELTLSMPTECLAMLSSEVLQAPKLVFDSCPPPASLLNYPSLPREVVISNVNDYDEAAEDKFWLELTTLTESKRRYENTTSLKICHTRSPDEVDTHKKFMTRLLPLATVLSMRGLVVVDEQERKISPPLNRT
jgi:hypothetical protein